MGKKTAHQRDRDRKRERDEAARAELFEGKSVQERAIIAYELAKTTTAARLVADARPLLKELDIDELPNAEHNDWPAWSGVEWLDGEQFLVATRNDRGQVVLHVLENCAGGCGHAQGLVTISELADLGAALAHDRLGADWSCPNGCEHAAPVALPVEVAR